MNNKAPDHYSYDFKLDMDKIPTKKADRIALSLLFPGLLAGVFLIALGVIEFINGLNPDNDVAAAAISSWFSLNLFDGVMVALGVWVIISLTMSYFTYKKVFFDGKKVTMIYRDPFGAKTTVKESIKKYQGVRFRVEFFQFGFLNKNKYIIELSHKDDDKTAPLYISTKEKDVRQIWEYYARKFNLPAIIMTDEGLLTREIADFGKPLSALYEAGLVKNTFDFKEPLPASVSWVRKKDKSVIKNRSFHWDGYNLLAAIMLVVCFLILAVNYLFGHHDAAEIAGCGVLAAVTLFAVIRAFTKDKLVIKPKKIVIVHKTFCLSRKKDEMMKDDIELVDVAFNPVSERYFVSIIGKGRTLIFGKKLPIEDLRWVKKFLINDIVKK